MGLGPSGSSLAQRVGLPLPVWENPFAMQLEAIARAEARRDRAIYLSMKNRVPRKPLAPVLPLGKVKGQERAWLWNGESIASKGLYNGHEYIAKDMRKAGFKLPALPKKEKIK